MVSDRAARASCCSFDFARTRTNPILRSLGRLAASSRTLRSVSCGQHARSMYRKRVQDRARWHTARSVRLHRVDSVSGDRLHLHIRPIDSLADVAQVQVVQVLAQASNAVHALVC